VRARIPSTLVVAVVLLTACAPARPPTTPPSARPTASSASVAPTATPAPTPVPTPAAAVIKLMDFNIEYGGDEIDFDKIIEAIKLADPDVVALEEAEGNTQKVADALGWSFASTRTQVVSKLPIIDPPGANGRYVLIEIEPGAVVALSNVHLPSDPYGPYDVRDGKPLEDVIKLEQDTRLPAVQERLDVLPALVEAGIPAFLTGDFNAPSHRDWTAAAVGTRPDLLYPVAWPVSTAVEAAGFRDAYRELHPDPVKDPGLTWWAGRPLVDGYPDHNDPQDRIDIIYSAGASTTTDFKIVGEQDGPQVDLAVDPWGSDHRAVVGTFTVTPGTPPTFVAVERRLVTVGDPVTVRYHGPAETVSVSPAGTSAIVDPVLIAPLTDPLDGTAELPTTALTPGDYLVQLRSEATVISVTPVSVAAVGAKTMLAIEPASVKAAAPFVASWRDGPGSRWDWIGIYERNADPLVDSYLFYVYTGQGVSGSVTVDANGEGDWPLPPGDYDAHYLLDDGYVSLAVAPFTVTK
jgi:endonuclease/exonuclease/phosphatase family metal-dependent hydrolase